MKILERLSLLRWHGRKLQMWEQPRQPAEGGEGELEDGGEADGLILVFISPTLAPTPPFAEPTEKRVVISVFTSVPAADIWTPRSKGGPYKTNVLAKFYKF